ncbi:TetR/AcrR family transcriptional regulator [Nocardia sp. NPDC003482]|uniref:TetR/AcrR family transcriptional regulator n=1 Tax=Nocardia sp. NPDC004068 TaxID=3364303 RepID=UPI0036CA4700
MSENVELTSAPDLAGRIAQRTLAKRRAGYEDEVRRLLDAALTVMRRHGTGSRPRVTDIVAAAGLSNDAFYRHFPSKDALVVALLEDGATRLCATVGERMDRESSPRAKVRRWVEGILSEADPAIADTTRAVLWNAGSLRSGLAFGASAASAPLAALLHTPFARLGSADPEFDAAVAAHALVGTLSDYLWRHTRPTAADVDRLTAFCLRAAASGQPS